MGTTPIHTVLSTAGLIDGGWNRHRSNSRNAWIFSVSFSSPCIFRRKVFQYFSVKEENSVNDSALQRHSLGDCVASNLRPSYLTQFPKCWPNRRSHHTCSDYKRSNLTRCGSICPLFQFGRLRQEDYLNQEFEMSKGHIVMDLSQRQKRNEPKAEASHKSAQCALSNHRI